jgi:hypothetical protein
MPMEADANAVAGRVLTGTENMRDSRNRLVMPIAISLVNSSGQVVVEQITTRVGYVQRYTATVTGGSDPLERIWTWRVPGRWFDVGSKETLDEANRIFAKFAR